ncbi:uncharacterized protein EI97DRAFT_467585 [Westerdykella ornata]|uniref:BHLH domain-containing protein n=1 Tax=Westerdykella ornata TaxID=318751 RepID=A0A6A6JI03_WESOR|nr:uncharacterized protein EI97DRAFT_467585 [Westerdykella ornata]KAF2275855.1 hypothetical protein EI97DRAFT_467585 [Westerdykella ornata]
MDGFGDSAWTNAHQFQPTDQQDFNSLLDLDLDLDNFSNPQGPDNAQNTYDDLANSFDTQHFFSPQVLPDQHHGAHSGQQDHYQLQQQHPHQANGAMTQPTDMFGNTMQQYDNPMATYAMHPAIPPTPNSAEMHPNAAQYLQQKRVQIAEQGFYPHNDDGSFTPLGTPAVTPNDVMHNGPDFGVAPGAYFSPLVSPALNAQNHPHIQMQSGQGNGSGSSAEASPTVANVTLNADSVMAPPEQGRRSNLRGNKRGAPGSANGPSLLGKSSVQKSSRRKVTASGMTKGSSESPTSSQGQTLGSMLGTAQTSSGNANSQSVSTSPESTSHPMGPPPRPGSVLHSPDPFGHGFHSPAILSQGGMTPPTPAAGFQQSVGFSGFPMLEDLSLPEASLAKTPLPRSDTAILDNSGGVEGQKPPKLAVNTPAGVGGVSGRPSPMLSAVNSPTSPAFTAGMKRPESRMARNTKKRGSVSTAPSPAIRPKISPNIKPLIAQQGANPSPDDHARLLATRSNYQNIIDGTNVPGLNYPTSLSANLTQKKQSHKVAEQHRRNRLNVALAQLDALLPGSPKILARDAAANGKNGIKSEGNGSGSGDGEEGGSATAGNSASSKAEKVEMAVKYIQELKSRIEALEREKSGGGGGEEGKETQVERMQIDEVRGKAETLVSQQGEAEARSSTSEASERSPD